MAAASTPRAGVRLDLAISPVAHEIMWRIDAGRLSSLIGVSRTQMLIRDELQPSIDGRLEDVRFTVRQASNIFRNGVEKHWASYTKAVFFQLLKAR